MSVRGCLVREDTNMRTGGFVIGAEVTVVVVSGGKIRQSMWSVAGRCRVAFRYSSRGLADAPMLQPPATDRLWQTKCDSIWSIGLDAGRDELVRMTPVLS